MRLERLRPSPLIGCSPLPVCVQMYASAVGTTVLQLAEIPPRPAFLDGALAIFGAKEGLDEAQIRNALEQRGASIKGFERRHFPPWVVWFETHEQALVALEASKQHVLGLTWTNGGAVKPTAGQEYSATSKLAEVLAIKTTFTQEELDGLLKASSIKFLKWEGFVCVKGSYLRPGGLWEGVGTLYNEDPYHGSGW